MDREVITPRAGGIEDVQSGSDARRLAIEAVGIRGLRHPIAFADGGRKQHTVAEVSLAIELPAERRGTHMSRFVALLDEHREALSARTLPAFLAAIAARLEAHVAEAEFAFPFFLEKRAPVSGIASRMDYEVRLTGRLAGGRTSVTTEVTVPVTSLCPCSKRISLYGAHNQRSHIRARTKGGGDFTIAELVALIEGEASAPLYAMLKREDEKYLTELAYENPKFVEDVVRDVAIALRRDGRYGRFRVEAENFESIHNHSAWAALAGACDD